MIREQFLSDITKANLFSFKLLRDSAYLIEAAVNDRRHLLEADRILSLVRIYLLDCIKFAHGFVKIEGDSVYGTRHTAAADKQLASSLLLDFDDKLYTEIEALTLNTVVEPGIRGSLFELQIRLSRELSYAAGRLYRLIECLLKTESTVGYPGYVLKGFSQLTAALIEAAESNAVQSYRSVDFPADTVPRFLDYIGQSIDRYEHKEARYGLDALTAPAEKANYALCYLISNRQKATHLPLLADLIYRAALI